MEKNQLMINFIKKEELKKAKERKQEGKTQQEILNLADKEYISAEEINEALGFENINETESKQDKENTDNNFQVTYIEDSMLEDYPYNNQPFSYYNDEEKNKMKESIKINGIMQPLIVRPFKNKYQILAGHNRRNCAKEIGIEKYPCIIKENLTDEQALIYLIDTNLCTRENITTMERAKAYRMKYDTYKKQNIKYTDIDKEVEIDNKNARDGFAKKEKTSNGTVQRYLRLTYLIDELQNMAENKMISIKAGEQISFLSFQEQRVIARVLSNKKIKLTEKAANEIREMAEVYRQEDEYTNLSEDEIMSIINEKNKRKTDNVKICFSKEEVERLFNGNIKAKDIKKYIIEKCS